MNIDGDLTRLVEIVIVPYILDLLHLDLFTISISIIIIMVNSDVKILLLLKVFQVHTTKYKSKYK